MFKIDWICFKTDFNIDIKTDQNLQLNELALELTLELIELNSRPGWTSFTTLKLTELTLEWCYHIGKTENY